MVHIYKNLVRENEATGTDTKTAGFIDLTGLKKAIVLISSMAQTKLDPNATSANEDQLKKLLQKERKANEEKAKTKKEMLNQIKDQDLKKKQELEKLKQQFEEEQKYKKDQLDKHETKNRKSTVKG